MSPTDRQRVIAAIKWMKTHQRSGANGGDVTDDNNTGGVYQRYVQFHSLGEVTAELSDFLITLFPAPDDTLHSVAIDGEEWNSPAKHPVTDVGLRCFLNEIPLSGARSPRRVPGGTDGGQSGGPFHHRSVDPWVPPDMVTGRIKKTPFANIKIRIKPSGSTSPTEFAFTRTPLGVQYRLNTYQISHRSAAFLPWHRVFLRLFEKELQFADKKLDNDGKITLPYWNWIRDADWDETSKSSVWHKENFGGFSDDPEGRITGDHFSHSSGTWKLYRGTPPAQVAGIEGDLRRRRKPDAARIPTVKTAKEVVNNPVYRGGRQFAGLFEHKLHDVVHNVVGGLRGGGRTLEGQMTDMLFSVQDPIFWLFHCNVDRIWSRWQWFFDKSEQYPKFGLLPGRRLNEQMQPWAVAGPNVPPYRFNVRVSDVLNAANFSSAVNSENLLGKGYKYDSLKL